MTIEYVTAVVESYRQRARFYRAEAIVRPPRLLEGLLDAARHVAEIPCGTGHFLAEYLNAGVAVTLVDACPDMLDSATEHACDTGLPMERVHVVLSTVQRMSELAGVDLVVMPNGAINQLICQMSLMRLLVGLRTAMRPGTTLLAQVACTRPDGGMDRSTFYDPRRQHGVWFVDRWFNPIHAGGAALRRRRQHRDGETLRIEFDYRNAIGERLHSTMVELALLPAGGLIDMCIAAGFVHVRLSAGDSGLSELLATTPDRCRS